MSVEALRALLDQVRRTEAAGDRIAAHRLLDRAPLELRRFGSFHYARGALAFRLGDVTRAVEAFEQAVQLEPLVAEFHANLGAALFERARRTGGLEPRGENAPLHADLLRAEAALQRAAELTPKLSSVFNNLGLVRCELGQWTDALDAFDRALSLNPRDVHALYNRAAALSQLNRHEESLTTLEAILEIDPSFGPARASRKSTLERLERQRRA
ncbi:MAG: tetratricopeptide repeat protein [Myxococcaceae bacterium]|nr:tetratricopeptide repeat protein [Myxococcaceae bacterium]